MPESMFSSLRNIGKAQGLALQNPNTGKVPSDCAQRVLRHGSLVSAPFGKPACGGQAQGLRPDFVGTTKSPEPPKEVGQYAAAVCRKPGPSARARSVGSLRSGDLRDRLRQQGRVAQQHLCQG